MAKEKVKSERVESSAELLARRETQKSWYRFNYLEQPGQKINATPGYTPIHPEAGQRKKKAEYHRFELQDGEVYELPQWFVDSLNSKEIPEAYIEKGPGGQIKSGTRMRNRFSLVPVAPPVAEAVGV